MMEGGEDMWTSSWYMMERNDGINFIPSMEISYAAMYVTATFY